MSQSNIGAMIRRLRISRHWTQQELAELCSFPGPWTVSRIEKQGTDSIHALEIVCKVLSIEVWELLRDAAEKNITENRQA